MSTDRKPHNPIEFQRVEWVFGLTGGEMGMSDEPFLDHGYHYDGAPEYAERDCEALCKEHKLDASSMATVISYGGGFMSGPADMIADDEGLVWHLVASFASSGETECPGRQEDDGIVKAEHCELSDTVRAQIEAAGDTVPTAGLHCLLCEESLRQPHGMIYIGEGYEAVYARPAPEDGEILGLGPDGQLIQWDADTEEVYRAETIEVFGEANIRPHEMERIEVARELHKRKAHERKMQG